MDGTYSIYLDDAHIGTAQVSKEGLYYRFHCDCQLEKKEVCKICVACGNDRIILGTPVPNGVSFLLNTKLPIKRFGAQKLHFYVAYADQLDKGMFVIVREEEPFPYLKNMKSGYVQVRGGVRGIFIPSVQK